MGTSSISLLVYSNEMARIITSMGGSGRTSFAFKSKQLMAILT